VPSVRGKLVTNGAACDVGKRWSDMAMMLVTS
jgi:hypothetical protein